MSVTFVDEKRMTAEDKAKYREYLVSLIDRALATDDFEISNPYEFREAEPQPGDTAVRREFTGNVGLHITWKDPTP